MKCLLSLEGDGLVWLVNYLDRVRWYITLPYLPLSLKLDPSCDDLEPSSPAFQKRSRELRTMRGPGKVREMLALESRAIFTSKAGSL